MGFLENIGIDVDEIEAAYDKCEEVLESCFLGHRATDLASDFSFHKLATLDKDSMTESIITEMFEKTEDYITSKYPFINVLWDASSFGSTIELEDGGFFKNLTDKLLLDEEYVVRIYTNIETYAKALHFRPSDDYGKFSEFLLRNFDDSYGVEQFVKAVDNGVHLNFFKDTEKLGLGVGLLITDESVEREEDMSDEEYGQKLLDACADHESKYCYFKLDNGTILSFDPNSNLGIRDKLYGKKEEL